MITLTPRTTPNTVKPLRILCARSVSIACFRFSPCACAMCVLTVRSEGFDGIKLCRAHCRIDAEEQADPGRQYQRNDHRAHGGLQWDRRYRATQSYQAIGRNNPEKTANCRKDSRFGDELQQNVNLARAERAANTN